MANGLLEKKNLEDIAAAIRVKKWKNRSKVQTKSNGRCYYGNKNRW